MAMHIEPPEMLWKYRKWNAHTLATIQTGELHFARIETLNDPFEFRWRHRFTRDPGEIDSLARELCAKHFPHDMTPQQREPKFRKLKADLTHMASLNGDCT